jgi:hypothetical protein
VNFVTPGKSTETFICGCPSGLLESPIHSMGPCSSPGEDLNAWSSWKQFRAPRRTRAKTKSFIKRPLATEFFYQKNKIVTENIFIQVTFI